MGICERIKMDDIITKKFYFHLSEAAAAWIRGASFERINRFCEIDEGEIVRYFRMSLQVLKEMHSSKTISESLKIKIAHSLTKINRDVVDAEKQLREG